MPSSSRGRWVKKQGKGRYEEQEPGKQDRFYSSLGIILGSRRSYIVLTLSGLPNYPRSPVFPGLEKCPFTLFAASRLFFTFFPSLICALLFFVFLSLSLSFLRKKAHRKEFFHDKKEVLGPSHRSSYFFKFATSRRSELERVLYLADTSCCDRARPSGLVISELSWKTRAGRRKKDSRVNSSFGVTALVSLLPLVFKDNLSRQLPLQLVPFPRPVHIHSSVRPSLPPTPLILEGCSSNRDAKRSDRHSLARSPFAPSLRYWKEVCGATSATTQVQRVHRENHYAPRPERVSATPRIVIFPHFLVIKISSQWRFLPLFLLLFLSVSSC